MPKKIEELVNVYQNAKEELVVEVRVQFAHRDDMNHFIDELESLVDFTDGTVLDMHEPMERLPQRSEPVVEEAVENGKGWTGGFDECNQSRQEVTGAAHS